MVCKDIVIEGKVNQDVTEVEHPTSTYKGMNESNETKVIGTVNLYTEGGSFISKSMFKPHLSQLLIFF